MRQRVSQNLNYRKLQCYVNLRLRATFVRWMRTSRDNYGTFGSALENGTHSGQRRFAHRKTFQNKSANDRNAIIFVKYSKYFYAKSFWQNLTTGQLWVFQNRRIYPEKINKYEKNSYLKKSVQRQSWDRERLAQILECNKEHIKNNWWENRFSWRISFWYEKKHVFPQCSTSLNFSESLSAFCSKKRKDTRRF